MLTLPLQAAPSPDFAPQGLLLTWQRDPTSTMTIQWLEAGELLPLAPGQEGTATPFQIPRLADPLELWRDGFAIEFLPTAELELYDPAEFSAESRLAWSSEGMIVAIRSRQIDFRESEEIEKLWAGGSVEIILTNPVAGTGAESAACHLVIAPGLDPAFPASRTHLYTPALPNGAAPLIKVTREPGGYHLQALIPWSALPGFDPREGGELTTQIYVNQGLRPNTKRLAWYPSNLSGTSMKLSHRIVLADTASAPYRATLTLERKAGEAHLTVHTLPEEAGKPVAVKESGKVIGETRLQRASVGRVARARLPIPLPASGSRWGVMEAMINGENRVELEPERYPSDYTPPPSVTLGYWKADNGAESERPERQDKHTSVLPLNYWPGMFLQRVELTGLAPDTVYAFAPKGYREGWNFRTLPTTLSRPVRIAMGGDTLHQQEWLEETTRAAISHDPDLIIWGGDIADSNGSPHALPRWQRWFSAIDRTLRTKERRVIPIVVAMGNHDVKKGYYHKHAGYKVSDEWRAYLAPEFYEFFAFPGQPGYGVLDVGDYLSIIVLDSGHTNPIAGTQTEWLEHTLKTRASRPHLLPIYHIPAYPSVKPFDGNAETEVRQHWPPLFDRYGIRTAFEHHNHAYKRTVPISAGHPHPGGTVYFGDGAWGVHTRPVHPAETTWYLEKAASERHAILLTLKGSQQHFRVITPKGELLDEYHTP